MNKLPIFICGGHFAPAYAIIEKLIKENKFNIYYLGRKNSFEYDEISKLNVNYLYLESGKLNRFLTLSTLQALILFPLGIIQSLKYLIRFKPKIVISFGSFMALPVAIASKILNIPLITHEQTMILGLSNRLISLLNSEIYLTFPETKKIPQFIKKYVIGLPIRNSILNPKDSNLTHFGNSKLPLIYITGGSQGSVSINSLISDIIPELLNKFRVFHVCGKSKNLFDYHRLSQLRLSQDKKISANYLITPQLDQKYVGSVMNKSAIIISRSGANTVFEILYLKKYSILIPLPWSAENEQFENAKFLEKLELATVLNQNRLKPNLLLASIYEAYQKSKVPKTNLNQFYLLQGTQNLYNIITKKLHF